MKSVIEKIQKRRKYPVPLRDGETLHVRPLGYWERGEYNSLEGDSRLVFAIGVCLVDEDGARVFQRNKDESLAEFVQRVRETTVDLTTGDVDALASAISKVTSTPTAETTIKNSEPTDTPAS